jgi:hypothetical protein
MQDLAKDGAAHYRKAKKFYDTVAAELIAHGHCMDIFACSLDQVRVCVGGDWALRLMRPHQEASQAPP